MIRRILLPLDDSPSAKTAMQYVVELYHKHGAYLTAMAIVDRPGIESAMVSMGIGSSSYAREGREKMLQTSEVKAFDMLSQFGELCNREGIPHIDREVLDAPVQAIIQGSHYVDLVVMGVASCQSYSEEDPTETARVVARDASAAVLTIPDQYRSIRKVVICFNGSVPAARVMHRYAHLKPFDVDDLVVLGAGNDEAFLDNTLYNAASYLEAHGHAPRVVKLGGNKASIPNYIEQEDVDMVVLGPHSGKIKSFFFGSLTKQLFREREVALFMFD